MLKIIFLAMLFWVGATKAFAYIDPSSGFPFLSLGPVIIGMLLGFLGGFFFLMKKFFNFFRGKFLIILLILLVVGFVYRRIIMDKYLEFPQKIVIIGMDALDPKLMNKFMKAGELPNFVRLKEAGSYCPLETVCPPESNVVWTSFATGMNPGNHGIFDFIMRDPHTYLPYLSLSEISSGSECLKIGPFKISLPGLKIKKTRQSPAFWEMTSKCNIPTYVYFCPGSFPPDKIYGKMISGMGVPDVRGTMGTFSFYSTKPLEKDKYTGGLVFQVKRNDNVINRT